MKENGKKILIADDEKPLANALQLKLANAGFTTKAVYDGAQAIENIKSGGWDLLLLDLVMPKADGFEVLKVIRDNKIKLPVIVLSNLSQSEDAKKAMALGVTDFFIKSDTPLAAIVAHINKFFKLS